MATWKAEVFVNSQVGKVTTEVEAATPGGAKEQIYAKHGNVQSITNLRQVNKNSSNFSGSSGGSVEGTIALIGLIFAGWAFFTFTPWILMGVGGAVGTWLGQLMTDQTLEDYDENDDTQHGKVAITIALALILGGVGFVKGSEISNSFNSPNTSTPTQVQQSK